MTMREHPAAAIFPMMGAAEIRDLADDITAHGQAEPIWLHRDGSVIDGRNRWRACELAGVEPVTKVHEGDDPGIVAFVVSLNLKRRHLSESQRAMVAARITGLPHGGDRGNQHTGGKSPIGDLPAVTRASAAQLLNTSKTHVDRARRVIRDAAPEVVAAVDSGDLKLTTADEIAKVPQEEQKEMIRPAPSGAPATAPSRNAVALPTRFLIATAALDRAIKQLGLLTSERQFRHNASQIAARHTGDLTRAIEALTTVLGKFPSENPEAGE